MSDPCRFRRRRLENGAIYIELVRNNQVFGVMHRVGEDRPVEFGAPQDTSKRGDDHKPNPGGGTGHVC